jgi:hypothetical protein
MTPVWSQASSTTHPHRGVGGDSLRAPRACPGDAIGWRPTFLSAGGSSIAVFAILHTPPSTDAPGSGDLFGHASAFPGKPNALVGFEDRLL